ncbi:MAG: T9SS type A sorting domain-containing protein [Bacteroidia bacterium]
MKKLLITFTFIIFASALFAQYAVGHRTFTFNDPTRTGGFGSGGGPGRQIQTEIYYPATTAGDNTPFIQDSFPIIVFGHGFSMAWDAYQNIWEEIVPKGYIMLFPRTEGGLSPSHSDFGLDLALIVNSFRALGQNPSSPYFNRVASTAAIMGHSMGGGATFLAAQNNTNITAIATLAPANTNPPSIAAARFVTVPTLVIAGANDCVTPPNQHQIPMYDSTASLCKTYISITGASHCQFANSNFNCNFGESTCSPGPTITRAVQHQRTFKYLVPWLNKYLKGSCHLQSNIDSLLNVSTTSEITWNQSCIPQAGIDKNLCSGESTLIGSTNMYGYTFNWTSNPSGFTSNQQRPTVSPSVTTTYFLSYTNQYSGCTRLDTVVINVVPSPVANAGADAGACEGTPVTIGSNPVSGNTYSWSPSTNLSNTTIANPQVNTNTVGTFQYVVTVSNSAGCTTRDTVVVSVSPSFTVQASGGNSVCANTPVQLNASIAPFMPTNFSSSTVPVTIPDNTPSGGLQTGNTLPTIAQLNNSSLAVASINLPHNNYVLKGITTSITHTFCGDLDIYLRSPNDVIFVISTDNGGSNDNYVNITFTDTAANFPPTSAALVANGFYKPEGATFASYTGPMQGLWRLYVVDDASGDVGQITDFKLNVLEVPSNMTYSWSPSIGLNNSTILNPIANATSTTTYTLTATHAGGCSQTASTTVTILASPVANAGNDVSICTGQSITIGSSPNNNETYQWTSNPSGFTSNISNPTISPTNTTTYYLTVTNTITNCVDYDTVVVNVSAQPNANITVVGNTTFCNGDSVVLVANSGYSNYNWSNGISGTNTITVTQSGSYTVTLGNSPTCQATSTPVIITVNNPIVPVISANATSICSGSNAVITVTNGTFSSYNWNGTSGNSSSVSVNQSGTYSVTTTDANGCSATSNNIIITVNTPVIPTITQNGNLLSSSAATSYQWYLNGSPINGATSQTYTATQNGIYTVETTDSNGCTASSNPINVTTIGINEAEGNMNVFVFPNPASGYFTIQLDNETLYYNITVTSVTGNIIYMQNNISGNQFIDCNNWASGMYLINVQSEKNIKTFRLVKH